MNNPGDFATDPPPAGGTGAVPDARTPYARAARAAAVVLALNVLLCAAKALAGWRGGSFALLGDALNNLTDVGLSIALLLGMKLAARPPDANHAYGHGKIEPELARAVGLLILATAGGIAAGAIHRLGDRHDAPHPAVVVTAAAAMTVKEWMFRYQRRRALETNSGALLADAVNHRFDVAATACVLLGTLGVHLGGRDAAWIDDVAAMLVAGFMAFAAIRVVIRASRELLDEMPPTEILDAVRRITLDVPGVLGVEKILGRKMGLHYLLDLHVEVAPEMTVDAAHDVARLVRRAVVGGRTDVANVMVHIEPHGAARDRAAQAPRGPGAAAGRALGIAAAAGALLLSALPARASSCHTELAIITDVDPEHVAAEARRVAALLAADGAPLDPAERELLDAACRDADAGRRLTVIQQVLDRRCLISVSISTEGEARAAPGPARPVIPSGVWAAFVVKVDNGARLASPLVLDSANAFGPEGPTRDRWMECALAPPGKPLSGRRLDYYLLRIRTPARGDREASFLCAAGARAFPTGLQRAALAVPVLFSIRTADEVRALQHAFAEHIHKEPRQGPPLAFIRQDACRRCHAEIDRAGAPPDRIAAENRCLGCHASGMPAPGGAAPAPAAARDPAPILALLPDADPDRGRTVFRREPVPACTICHRLEERGTAVGPDLAGLARRAAPAEALASLLTPGAKIADGFRQVVITTADERIETGIVRRESPGDVVLVQSGGREVTVPRRDILDLRALDTSLMPENVAGTLTDQEMADLLKYLLARP